MRVISVIACGPSALRCGAKRSPGIRIAVNDAYRYVECSHVVSMDGRWFENRAADFCDAMSPLLYIRGKTIAKRVKPDGCLFRTFKCEIEKTEFSESRDQLNGDNSGYCALNLAYIMRPERIYLYGFDMKFQKGSDHFFGDYPWKGEGCTNSGKKFAKWSAAMSDAARQFDRAGIEVFNTNSASAIKAFKFGRP